MKKFLRSHLWFLSLLYLTFVALGLPDTGFGVAWNEMHLTFEQPLAYAGIINSIVILCGAISGFYTNRLLAKYSITTISIISIIFTGIAMIGYAFAPTFLVILLCSFPLGFGAGAVDTSLNTYAAHHLSVKQMNWLHSFWGVGATLSPFIVTFGIVQYSSWRIGYLLISILVLLVAVLLYLNRKIFNNQKESIVDEVKSRITLKAKKYEVYSILTYMLYVAMESTFGLWLSAVLIQTRGIDIGHAGYLTSFYFLMIMSGRFLLGMIASKIGSRKLVTYGLSIAFTGGILFFFPQPLVYACGVMFIGFGFAPIYPSLMHETSLRFPHDQANQVISRQIAFSYISLLFVVPSIGFLAQYFSLQIVPYFMIVGMIGLAIILNILNKNT